MVKVLPSGVLQDEKRAIVLTFEPERSHHAREGQLLEEAVLPP
jgi:hypothetical protein